MEFNLSTFLLEIVNFLVLIWILQRLFYKPLLGIIAKRKQSIEQTLADAQSLQQQAETQRSLYENRQKLWEQEKQAALQALQQQLDAEKAKQLAKLNSELTQERQKMAVALHRQQQELLHQAEKQALQNAARFAATLLQQTASPALHQQLLDLLLARLQSLPLSCKQHLQALPAEQAMPIRIASAYALTDAQRQQLETHLTALAEHVLAFHYREEPALIAGVRIDVGAWLLNANIQQELAAFAELAHDRE